MNDTTTIELNKGLRTGRLLRLHFKARQGQAIVKPNDNGLWNHRAVRKAIYDNMPENWHRYTIGTIELESGKVIINFKRESINGLAEAWQYFLGGVISDPPVREF